MPTRRTLLTLAALPLLLLPLGCAGQADDPMTPETRSADAPLQALRVELTMPAAHSDPEAVAQLVEHLEGQADVAQAKASVHKTAPEGGAEVEVELWGHDLPTEDELVAELQAEFPHLAGVAIVVSPIDTVAEAPPHEQYDEDPEALRQRIIDDLHAKGVDGEIDVQIVDHPDGRREVRVEVEDDEPPPA